LMTSHAVSPEYQTMARNIIRELVAGSR
jgi:hypothetical protein